MRFDYARQNMVAQQVRVGGVADRRVIEVMSEVPREQFVPDGYRELAFADTSIPLPHGQFMLHPALEGQLLQALDLDPGDSVLEIGTGSGFMTACLARLAREVLTVDIFEDLVEAARGQLAAQKIHNVEFETGDLFEMQFTGHYDAIAVTGSVPEYDDRMEEWLKPGGRLFVVVGQAPLMKAQRITSVDEGVCTTETLFETVLLPLIQRQRVEPFRF